MRIICWGQLEGLFISHMILVVGGVGVGIIVFGVGGVGGKAGGRSRIVHAVPLVCEGVEGDGGEKDGRAAAYVVVLACGGHFEEWCVDGSAT